MGTGAEIAIAAAIVGTAATAASIYQANKAADAAEDAQKGSAAASQNEASQARRAAAREARIKRAKILQSASNMGVAGSSATTGATSELSGNLNQMNSQQGANIQNAASQSALAGKISHANQMSQNWSAVGSIAQQGLSAYSMWDSNKTSGTGTNSGTSITS